MMCVCVSKYMISNEKKQKETGKQYLTIVFKAMDFTEHFRH